MLAVVTGITFLTNCTKQEITQNEDEEINNYWYPTLKDIVLTDIPLSQLADSIEKYNTLQQYTNYIIEGYVIMDTVKYTSLVFNPDDYVTFNDESTGIEELKSTVTGKANVKFIETDTISNTLHLGSAFNYDGQGGLNPEINEILAENPMPVDTFHWTTAKYTENNGIILLLDANKSIADISGALITKNELVDFHSNNGNNFPITIPTELALLQENDTIPWGTAVSTFGMDSNLPYINGVEGFIQTEIPSSYPQPYIEAIIDDEDENYPGITFLYQDTQDSIPASYYNGGKGN